MSDILIPPYHACPVISKAPAGDRARSICLDLSQLAVGVVTADGGVVRASAGDRAPS